MDIAPVPKLFRPLPFQPDLPTIPAYWALRPPTRLAKTTTSGAASKKSVLRTKGDLRQTETSPRLRLRPCLRYPDRHRVNSGLYLSFRLPTITYKGRSPSVRTVVPVVRLINSARSAFTTCPINRRAPDLNKSVIGSLNGSRPDDSITVCLLTGHFFKHKRCQSRREAGIQYRG